MVFVDESLDEMLKKIKCKRLVRDEILIPNKKPEFFYPSDEDPDMIMISDEFIEGLGEFAKRYNFEIFELFSNSINRGNNYNGNLPIITKVFGGTKSSRGSVLRIEDTGKGFPFKEYIKSFENGESIHQGQGLGLMRNLVVPNLYVSYEGAGNIVNVRSTLGA